MSTGKLRVIVCPHDLNMGGSQINALELAAQAERSGYEVILYAPNGPLSAHLGNLGLRHVASPPAMRLSLHWMKGLRDLVQEWKADLVHTYEWAPSLAGAYAMTLLQGTNMVMTVLSMDIPDFLPRNVPLIVGTEQLRRHVVQRPAPVYLMEPPVDTEFNSRDSVARTTAPHLKKDGEILISIVCRLTDELDKAAGVIQAIAVIEQLAKSWPVRLVIAGDGDAMPEVRRAADQANARLSTESVVLLGEMSDPRRVYSESDICLGMGSSALKALSFGKPLVVQGAGGFWKILDPISLPEFQLQGFYGEGGAGARDLDRALRQLCTGEDQRQQLGSWGRKLAVECYSLQQAGAQLDSIYQSAKTTGSSRSGSLRAVARSTYDYAKFLAARQCRTGGEV